jgi:hypothetical protein
MKFQKPTPKTDIEEFKDPKIYSGIYLEIIEVLEKENIFKDKFETLLDFLNFHRDKYNLVFMNIKRPEDIVEHFLELDLSKKQLYFVVKYILLIIKSHDFIDVNRNGTFWAEGYKYIYDNLFSKLREQLKIGQVLSDKENKNNTDISSQQIENKTEDKTPTFINNFDSVDPIVIFKHFKSGLVEKGYLTEIQLEEYLKTAFELNEIPEIRLKFKKSPQKGTIMKVFYEYYINVASKYHGKQKQYAALLGEYFEGYKTSNVSTNFNKYSY